MHVRWNDDTARRRTQLIRFAYGITTAREAGSLTGLQQSLTYRAASNDRSLAEPRLVVSAILDESYLKSYGDSDYGALTKRLATMGADAIKIYQAFSPEEWRSIVAEARAAGIPVWGHVWTFTESHLDRAISAGASGVTHMPAFSAMGTTPAYEDEVERNSTEYWLRTRERWLHVDNAAIEAVAHKMAALGAWFEPTLLIERDFTLEYPVPDEAALIFRVPSLWDHLRPYIPVGGGSRWALSDRRRRIDAAYARMCATVGMLFRSRVTLVAGTDNAAAGVSLSDEIGALRGCGVPAMDAIRTATRNAAAALNRTDVGVIEAGRLADFVLLTRDPLESTDNLRQIWRVVKGGVMYDPARLLADLRAEGNARRDAGERVLIFQVVGGVLAIGLVLFAAYRIRRRQRSTARQPI